MVTLIQLYLYEVNSTKKWDHMMTVFLFLARPVCHPKGLSTRSQWEDSLCIFIMCIFIVYIMHIFFVSSSEIDSTLRLMGIVLYGNISSLHYTDFISFGYTQMHMCKYVHTCNTHTYLYLYTYVYIHTSELWDS